MSITELQELMDENEKFLLGEIQKLKSQGKVEELMKGEKDADKI